MESLTPDYKKIYTDIISKKFPEKKYLCKSLLKKEKLSTMDVIAIDQIIFSITCKETELFNQKHRSYSKIDIINILEYQKKHKLNNSQLAIHFKMSRNTISKWKKRYM
jgi:DNA-binding transcriptional regulator YiaG